MSASGAVNGELEVRLVPVLMVQSSLWNGVSGCDKEASGLEVDVGDTQCTRVTPETKDVRRQAGTKLHRIVLCKKDRISSNKHVVPLGMVEVTRDAF